MLYKRSVFFVPVRTDDPYGFRELLQANGRWTDTPQERYLPHYLLPYATRIAREHNLFASYTLNAPQKLHIHLFRDKENGIPDLQISEIRFSCFGTGTAFLEFWVCYPESTTADQIADFAYRFKKATHAKPEELAENDQRLYEAVLSLLPEGCDAQAFFTSCADFKRECLCYHFLALPEEQASPDDLKAMLLRLRRNYSSRFMPSNTDGTYDMLYEPYPYDHWAGSSEGLVNITCDCEASHYFLNSHKEQQLSTDFYFAWLLLLNQRFSAINCISAVARAEKGSARELDAINRSIVSLKTVYAFNIISDDMIVQNLYARMYAVMDVDRLLEDIRDNENQMEILQNARSAEAEQMTSKVLTAISLLSLFSVLIDASSFFDRISWLMPIATALGLACTIGTAVLCIIWIYHTRNK